MSSFGKELGGLIANGYFNTVKPLQGALEFVKLMQKYNLKFIASDFDYTMIAKHSGGYLDPQRNEDILYTVTRDFKALSDAIKTTPIKLAVVTFSDPALAEGYSSCFSGEKMVNLALEKSNCDAKLERIYAFYPRLYKDKEMYTQLGLKRPMPSYKEYHLRQICNDFQVELNQIVLIDDDLNNCKNAKELGAVALHVTGHGLTFSELRVL